MKSFIAVSIFGLSLYSCNTAVTKTDSETGKVDTIVRIEANANKEDTKIKCDPLYAQYAALISGDSAFAFDETFKPFINDSGFKAFSRTINARWSKFETNKLAALKTWQKEHTNLYPKSPKTIFYPFSGPDILFATQFYPEANNFILIGLEPVGTYPSLSDSTFTKHIGKYYNNINTSLNAILKFSFFRTISMESDFKNTHVNGTIHLLNLFLTKMGCSVCLVEPMAIDNSGNSMIVASFEELNKSDFAGKGVHIVYKDKGGNTKQLTYWSADISDPNMEKHPELLTYLKSLPNVHSYMKGASYLCYLADFDEIRNVIIEKSETLLQDDSGVPVRFFLNDQWQLNFFGTYKKPISLFAHKYQAKLDSIYNKTSPKPEALDFGIGYIYEDKASNMMLAVRK
jgi:hypothetical protein